MDQPSPPRATLAGERIEIGAHSLSASQYRWLFYDLLENLPDGDAAALGHFRAAGQQEIAEGLRVPQQDRLAELQIQQFSLLAPDAGKSPCFAYRPGTTDTLDIYFSYPVPGEMFAPPVPTTASSHARLHVKELAHCYYQRGIPGISASIDETAQWLERVIAWLKPRRLRTFGLSAGGYASIVFGQLLSADTVFSVAPEVSLGNPYYRSRRWSPDPDPAFDPRFRDITLMIETLSPRLALIYPAYDMFDFEMIRLSRARAPKHLGYMPSFHPGLGCLDMPALAQSDATMPAMRDLLIEEFDFRYDDAAIASVIRAYEHTMDRDYATSLPLLRALHEQDPSNHGLLTHIGFQQALRGQRSEGLTDLRAALDGILAVYADEELALHTRRSSRSPIRYYYDLDRGTIAMLERLWDEAAGDRA